MFFCGISCLGIAVVILLAVPDDHFFAKYGFAIVLFLLGFWSANAMRDAAPDSVAPGYSPTHPSAGHYEEAADIHEDTLLQTESEDEPMFNIDGTPMCGGLDTNGNPFGVID